MAQLDYNEIRERKIIIHNEEPCEVIESHVARTQQRKPQNQVKLKSLISGKTFAATFHTSDSAEEADLYKKEVKFLFANKGEYWFCDAKDASDRFQIKDSILGTATKFLKVNMLTDALVFAYDDEDTIIGVKLPIKMEFKITEAPPSIKGNTVSGGSKQVTLETGAVVSVPLFIDAGDAIVVNTETGEYVERVRT
jgi:elongation factor P